MQRSQTWMKVRRGGFYRQLRSLSWCRATFKWAVPDESDCATGRSVTMVVEPNDKLVDRIDPKRPLCAKDAGECFGLTRLTARKSERARG